MIRTKTLNGRVEGVNLDGMVYYPYKWNSTGIEATIEAQEAIPPVCTPICQDLPGSTIDEFMGLAGRRRLAQVNESEIIAGGNYLLNYTNHPVSFSL